MIIDRLDLDGAGSPSALVTRILEIERDIPIPVPVEALCERLGITAITELETEGFEAALITDGVKSAGAILLARGRDRRRRRFSIGHELGHFLIPAHRAPPGVPFLCSPDQMRCLDVRDEDRRRRMEAEANRFAAMLLMPPPILRAELRRIRRPEVNDIVRLAELFDVSKDAMARAFVDYSRAAVAIIVVRDGKVLRLYRNERTFPWIEAAVHSRVPGGSLYHERMRCVGKTSEVEECEPELWLGASSARKVEVLTEQVLGQKNDFALIMLHAEMRGDDIR